MARQRYRTLAGPVSVRVRATRRSTARAVLRLSTLARARAQQEAQHGDGCEVVLAPELHGAAACDIPATRQGQGSAWPEW